MAELRAAVSEPGRLIASFQLEGTVCALAVEPGIVALQDESATVLLELPTLPPELRAGNRLMVTGRHGAVTRGRFALQLGTAPVVDVDGRHPPLVRSGQVYLEAGKQPLRLDWFNGVEGASVRLEFEGPGLARQEVAKDMLWRNTPEGLQSGLDYAAYEGERWGRLPEFDVLTPVARGVTETFDVGRRTRDEEAGLSFRGFIQITTAGLYTFHLSSDDGGRVFIGGPETAVKSWVTEHEPLAPVTRGLPQVLAGGGTPHWMAFEGLVTFAAAREGRLELEMSDRGIRLPVTVMDAAPERAATWLRQRVRVTGIGEAINSPEQERVARLVVVREEQVELLEEPQAFAPTDLLTTAKQIRSLSPPQARQPYQARVRGVVTMTTPVSLVLQDETGGVFVHYESPDWVRQPRPEELWEIEGRTDPGDFSPVIRAARGVGFGSAPVPEPIQPTWEQLMNGSLDAEWVELEGVITAVTATEIHLLTRDGRVRINSHEYYPLPRLLLPPAQLTGSIVRLRGVFTANWDWTTGLVKGGEFFLGNAVLGVDELMPPDPFLRPTVRATDLLLFTSQASGLKRVKLAGQILFADGREGFLLDGTNGFRLQANEPLAFQAGDLVEAVGFPRLGGPSLVVVEAQARRTGAAPLPPPVLVSVENLMERGRDATHVRMEARLLSDVVRERERVLELQAGVHHFLARLRSEAGTLPKLIRGSRLQVTGVFVSAPTGRSDHSLDAFELLLIRPGDVLVLERGPWWTVRHTMTVGVLLVGCLGLALAWITQLRRQVEQRTAELGREIETRQRAEQSRAMEQERTRVAQDLHDELGAGLTEVGILGALAKNPAVAAEKRAGYLEQLMTLSESLVTGLDEIVWAVNPRYDSVADLASYYSLFAQRFLNLAGITCRLQVAKSIPAHPLDARSRHGVFLAFKEALNNIVRHSRATEVRLAIIVTAAALKISLADNGRGMDGVTGGTGRDGLTGMRQRLAQLGGDCTIHSQPGAGTTVEFTLPLERITS